MRLPTTVRRPARVSARTRLVAQTLVLTAVVAGTTGFAALHKQVTLEVDGYAAPVTLYGRTVADVLAARGVEVGEHDLVTPALDATVSSDSRVVVQHARELQVVVDGQERTVWSTALTVGGVVDELGLRDSRTSVSRSSAPGRDVLRLSTLKQVHVAVDGSTLDLSTTGATVREVLADAGVVLGEHDLVSVPLDAAAVDGLVVMVTRVQTVIGSQTETTPFQTVRQDDASLLKGNEVTATRGQDGSAVVTYEAYTVDGVEIGRTVLTESVLTEPVDEVIRVGTGELPQVAAVEPGTARAVGLEMVLARGWDQQQFACLDSLWSRESGWRVNASNASSGAYGIPQALPGSKMAAFGADWRTNPATQIAWGLSYISGRYGTPCGAWGFFQSHNWY
ncbi:ubiquitin-like domain-containing protein [Actinotalea sp. M2MS4P-6]|uniref:aggregation-promoting factor C-terminal-like domain-containing protein n=1 Tax=Actinotalea sp. M2MS4P-6 TaxID=2983762 RepID=UPI0021E36644|nr:ubiquitin-like domain-containing protein [Actinotalea sp. M2MS4P-6]MCV2395793.1 ubiquitin-like domain-containing protein [Actinotalea sp. M2MS4P-6]